MKAIVATEIWNTADGKIAKAAVRDSKGRFLGATNQTKGVKVAKSVRPRVALVGR
jgi:hypothetical protein